MNDVWVKICVYHKKMIAFFLFIIFPVFVHAQTAPIPRPGIDITCDDLVIKVYDVAVALRAILGAVAVIMILIAAYNYLTAGDDPQKVKKAHLTITWAVVGVAVALLSEGLVLTVETIIAGEGGGLPSICSFGG